MRLFPQELDIPLSEGFSPRLDLFGRKPFGDRLTNIVKSVESPLVALLDAPWGYGKTTFVKMWLGELYKNKIPAIYFDAFANDYQQDAFIAISSEIIGELDRRKAQSTAVVKFKRKAVGVAKIIGLSALRIGVKAATAGTVEYGDLSKTASEVTQSLSEEAEKGLEEILRKRLENHEEQRLAFSSFKDSLSELAFELSSELAQEGGSDQTDSTRPPLVFIIDELDRCKPPFALEIIERIKHLFSVPGVSFFLVCSLEQLVTAVRYSYGNIDAHMYLEKFYHLRVLFPSDNLSTRDLMASTYLKHLGCDVDTTDIIYQFTRYKPLSLRTLERVVLYLKVARASIPTNALFMKPIIVILCIFKVTLPNDYDLLRRQKFSYKALDDRMKFDQWRAEYNNAEISKLAERMQSLWQYILGASEGAGEYGQLGAQLVQYSLDRDSIIPHYCRLIDGFSFPDLLGKSV